MEDKIYKIGDYEFETLREYRQAQDDLKKIKYITDELDIYDPEVALQLYNMMRDKKIRFKSEIGKSFFWCISDIVAEQSQNMLVEKQAKEEAAAEERLPFHFQLRHIVGIVCIVIAISCGAYFAISEYTDYLAAKKLQELQAKVDASTLVNPSTEQEQTESDTESVPAEPQILDEYAALHAQNPEMVGWISIPDTDIDYPVMQSSAEESDFYLTHDFNKEEDSNGTPFLDARNQYQPRDTNLIIYGHNMKSGLMFGTLKKYLDEDYLEEHRTIKFDTLYEKGTYEIIAVCLAKVEYQDEEVFRYYNFLNATSEQSFQEYLENITKLSVYDTPIEAEYGDQLLTLSTCNSYTEDGRMFLVAKRRDAK